MFLLVFRGEDDKKAHYPNWARGSKKRVIRHPCSLRARPPMRSYIARLYLSTRTEHEIEQFVLQKCSQNTNFVRFVITPAIFVKGIRRRRRGKIEATFEFFVRDGESQTREREKRIINAPCAS